MYPCSTLVRKILFLLGSNLLIRESTYIRFLYYAPPGTYIAVQKKPAVRGSWEIQGIDGLYLGQALHHYYCFEVLVNNTANSLTEDTVEFLLHHITVTFISSAENYIEAAEQLAHALLNPLPGAPL